MDAPTFYVQDQDLIEPLMERFANEELDLVEVVYNRASTVLPTGARHRSCILPAGGADADDAKLLKPPS